MKEWVRWINGNILRKTEVLKE